MRGMSNFKNGSLIRLKKVKEFTEEDDVAKVFWYRRWGTNFIGEIIKDSITAAKKS
jgi:hypothetical protein